MFAEYIASPVPRWLMLFVCGGGVLIAISIAVAVVLLVTRKKDRGPSDWDKR